MNSTSCCGENGFRSNRLFLVISTACSSFSGSAPVMNKTGSFLYLRSILAANAGPSIDPGMIMSVNTRSSFAWLLWTTPHACSPLRLVKTVWLPSSRTRRMYCNTPGSSSTTRILRPPLLPRIAEDDVMRAGFDPRCEPSGQTAIPRQRDGLTSFRSAASVYLY
jgi:hypothetical protein